ncbi:MAG: hypothetical protein IJD43_11235 [Thermoguttaceae bacterium]|nr:hypothetical protein [Thermoguttaceae bacterium]
MDPSASRFVLGRRSLCFFLLAALCLTCVTGCGQALGVLIHGFKGDNLDPPCMEMEGKVAVIVRPRASTTYQYGDVSNELARVLNVKIGLGLKNFKKKKREKITLIPHDRIQEYSDGMHAETDFVEIGKAVGADQVVAVDLLGYNHIAGTNVWQGHANVNVQLIDVKTGDIVYQPDSLAEYIYPRNNVVSATDKSEFDFQREYILRLGNYISKQFVPYSRFEVDF